MIILLLMYIAIAAALYVPVFRYTYKENRDHPNDYFWEPKQVLALWALGKVIIWPLYLLVRLHDFTVDRWYKGLEEELGGTKDKPLADSKAIALGSLDDEFEKLKFEYNMLEANGWNMLKLLKMSSIVGKSYEKNKPTLTKAGWSDVEVYNMFDKYIPDTRLARMLKMK